MRCPGAICLEETKWVGPRPDFPEDLVQASEGGMMWLEALVELELLNSSFSSLSSC